MSEGAGLWLNKLYQLTASQTLAVGDWKAILGHILTVTDTDDMMVRCSLTDVPDNFPLGQYSNVVSA